MNIHHKCQTKVANLCGINQKLLAEALTQVSMVGDPQPALYLVISAPGATYINLHSLRAILYLLALCNDFMVLDGGKIVFNDMLLIIFCSEIFHKAS